MFYGIFSSVSLPSVRLPVDVGSYSVDISRRVVQICTGWGSTRLVGIGRRPGRESLGLFAERTGEDVRSADWLCVSLV